MVQKFRKPPVPDDRFLLWKCESGEDLLAYVMVAPAGVCAVPALDTGQNVSHLIRVLDRVVIIVEEISGNADEIDILGVNGVYDLSYMGLRGVVSKVKIRDQGDLKSRKRRTLFDDARILPHIDLACRTP